MADELLPYYEKELAYIRQMGAEFARENPKIASRLGINADTIEDPHASRLVEGFAYLNARIQHKLDDDFPELSDALLSVIFPHYQRPFPSTSIVQFVPDREQLEAEFLVARNSLLETEQFQGENCRFSTAYDTRLYPIEIYEAKVYGLPLNIPGSSSVRGASGALKIGLRTFNKDIEISKINLNSLRLYLRGQHSHIHSLYEFMMNDCIEVAMTTGPDDTHPTFLGKQFVQPVGFKQDEALLPYPPHSFMGYRLLTEYFIFPEKFMFADLVDINSRIPAHATDQLDFYFFFNKSDVELENNIDADTFALGCTPVVNLFKQKTDPIKLDHTQLEYQVVPDVRRPVGFEVYSIDKVVATDSSGARVNYLPFYGSTHEVRDDERDVFWFASRRNAKLGNYERDDGTDMFLSLVDLHFNPNIPDDRTLLIDTHCSNRDLPSKLPFNLEQPRLQCVDGAPPCERIRCLIQPTSSVRPPLRNFARWRLISHLNINHLSLTGRGEAAESFREILRLYDFKESSVTRALIASVNSVNAKPISAPLTIDGRATLCRGVEVEIELDTAQLSGSSSFLFATVLEHFFGLYCSVNSFTRVLIKIKNKEGYLKKCPPRAGEKVLL